MKKVYFIFLMSFAILFISCKNDSVTLITTSNDVFNLNALNVSQSFTINANFSWTAKSADSWCTLSDSTGTGNKQIVIVCKDNLSEFSRETNITIHAGDQTKTVIIKQKSGVAFVNENFNDNSGKWIQTIDSVSNTIDNGFLDIHNTAKYYSYFIGTKSLIPDFYSSYMIVAQYEIISGTGPFGITFGFKDPKNYYRILVFPGYFFLSNISDGVDKTILSGGVTDNSSENTIRIVKNGSNCTISINSMQIKYFYYSPYGPYVGFFSCPQSDIYVDYLKIIQF